MIHRLSLLSLYLTFPLGSLRLKIPACDPSLVDSLLVFVSLTLYRTQYQRNVGNPFLSLHFLVSFVTLSIVS